MDSEEKAPQFRYTLYAVDEEGQDIYVDGYETIAGLVSCLNLVHEHFDSREYKIVDNFPERSVHESP